MSIRTTVTLDDDVVERVKQESKSRGASFRETLNELIRAGLVSLQAQPKRRVFKVRATAMGYRPDLNQDKIESLIEYSEGPFHR
jgi:hypothetical protein